MKKLSLLDKRLMDKDLNYILIIIEKYEIY